MRLLDLIKSIEHGTEGLCPDCGGCCPDVEFDSAVRDSLGHKPGCDLRELKLDLENASWRAVYEKWIQN